MFHCLVRFVIGVPPDARGALDVRLTAMGGLALHLECWPLPLTASRTRRQNWCHIETVARHAATLASNRSTWITIECEDKRSLQHREGDVRTNHQISRLASLTSQECEEFRSVVKSSTTICTMNMYVTSVKTVRIKNRFVDNSKSHESSSESKKSWEAERQNPSAR